MIGDDDKEFSRLAWEVARRARFQLDEERENDWKIRASVAVATGGEVKAWGCTHNEALQNLACGLDNWAEDWDESEPASQSVSTDQLIVMKGVTL